MKKLLFLTSGGGGNLKFIFKYLQLHTYLDFYIDSVIADRECGAYEFARENNISAHIISYSKESSESLENLLHKIAPDLIIANFLQIINCKIVNSFMGKLINLHYSILPAFKYLRLEQIIEKSLELNCGFVGSTTHYIDMHIDGGKIISQCVIPVHDQDLYTNIVEVVFRSGCFNLLNSIYKIFNLSNVNDIPKSSLLKLNNMYSLFSPGLLYNCDFVNDEFWNSIKE